MTEGASLGTRTGSALSALLPPFSTLSTFRTFDDFVANLAPTGRQPPTLTPTRGQPQLRPGSRVGPGCDPESQDRRVLSHMSTSGLNLAAARRRPGISPVPAPPKRRRTGPRRGHILTLFQQGAPPPHRAVTGVAEPVRQLLPAAIWLPAEGAGTPL
jgi:hypothetical protein